MLNWIISFSKQHIAGTDEEIQSVVAVHTICWWALDDVGGWKRNRECEWILKVKKNEKIWVEFLQWMATTNDTEHSRFSAVAAVPSIHFFPLKISLHLHQERARLRLKYRRIKERSKKKCLKMLNRKISPHRLFCLLSFLFFIDHLILSLLRLLLSARFLLALKFYLYSQTQRFNRELELLREWGGCLALDLYTLFGWLWAE